MTKWNPHGTTQAHNRIIRSEFGIEEAKPVTRGWRDREGARLVRASDSIFARSSRMGSGPRAEVLKTRERKEEE